MESNVVRLISLLVMFLVFGTVLFFVFQNPNVSQSCGGISDLSCPLGYRCQLASDPDSSGECVSLIAQLNNWIYTIIPQLKPKTAYTCPAQKWVDCIPPIGDSKPECAQAYLDWAKSHCPDFEGAAY